MADEIEIPCLSFDLARLAGTPGAQQLQANFRDLRDFSKKLSLYLDQAADAVQGDEVWINRTGDVMQHIQTRTEADGVTAVPEEAAGVGGAFLTNIMVDPTNHGIVTQRANPHVMDVHSDDAWIVVAADHGIGHAHAQAAVVGKALNGFAWNVQLDDREHVVECNGGAIYGDTWITPTWDALGHYDFAHTSAGVANAGQALGATAALIQTMTRDLCHHLKGATSATADGKWIQITAGAVNHIASATASAGHDLGTATAILQTITRDACDHVKDSTNATGDSWIIISAGGIKHTATTGTGVSITAGAGSAVQNLYLDACNHVTSASFIAVGPGGTYTAGNFWITVSGTAISHTTGGSATVDGSAGTSPGSASAVVGYIEWDAAHHVITATSTYIVGDANWIVVACSGTMIQISHTGPFSCAAWNVTYSSSGKVIASILADGRGHIISVTYGSAAP